MSDLKGYLISMALLILDTSTDYMLMGLVEEGRLLASIYTSFHREHAEQLLPQFNNLLIKASRTIQDIDVGCISIGPGSFTGVRLGLTFMKVLALSHRIKVYTVSSLLILGLTEAITFAWIDARAKRVYGALYEYGKQRIAPRIFTNEDVQKLSEHYPNATHVTFDATFDAPTHLLRLATYLLQQAPVHAIHTITPLYLKDVQ
jgi:tRNA threonylcarbamoyl adenosine modification protein YeaZ